MIEEGVIVKFNESVNTVAGEFCRQFGLTGKVIGRDTGRFVVDYGLPYTLFAPQEHLDIVVTRQEIPVCPDGD